MKSQKSLPKYIALIVVAVVLFGIIPGVGSNYMLNIITLMLLYTAMSQMWNLLGGYAGMLSLGMQAFIGIGGYTLTMLSVQFGVNIYVSIIVGAIICALFGLAVSPAIFKMSGVYFAIGTWIIAVALSVFFSNWKFVGYAKDWGINSVYGMSMRQLYYTALVVAVISVLVVFFLLRTKTGLALMAIRDSASAAETMGVELYKTKLKCYVIACFMMGLIGGAQFMQTAYINPDTGFSINWTIAMTFAVIIGGLGTMEGPIVGAVIYVIIVQVMYNFPGMSNIVLGILAIVIILLAPSGIMGTLYEKTGFQILSPRRSIPLIPKKEEAKAEKPAE